MFSVELELVLERAQLGLDAAAPYDFFVAGNIQRNTADVLRYLEQGVAGEYQRITFGNLAAQGGIVGVGSHHIIEQADHFDENVKQLGAQAVAASVNFRQLAQHQDRKSTR